MLTEADILEGLRACFEPRTKLNVVDLGLVRAVRLEVDREAPGAGIMGVPVRQRLVVRLLAAANEDEDAWSLLQGQVANQVGGYRGFIAGDGGASDGGSLDAGADFRRGDAERWAWTRRLFRF